MNDNKRKIVLSILGFTLILLGCSDDPTETPDPELLTAALSASAIDNGDSVLITYEIADEVDAKYITIRFIEPNGTPGVTGFPNSESFRYFGPIYEAGEWEFYVRVTKQDDSIIDTPHMFCVVGD